MSCGWTSAPPIDDEQNPQASPNIPQITSYSADDSTVPALWRRRRLDADRHRVIRARGWNLRAGADGATTGFDADVVAPIDKIRCLVLQVLVAGRCAEPPPTATHPPTSWTAVRAYKAVAAASAARRNFVFEQQQAGRE